MASRKSGNQLGNHGCVCAHLIMVNPLPSTFASGACSLNLVPPECLGHGVGVGVIYRCQGLVPASAFVALSSIKVNSNLTDSCLQRGLGLGHLDSRLNDLVPLTCLGDNASEFINLRLRLRSEVELRSESGLWPMYNLYIYIHNESGLRTMYNLMPQGVYVVFLCF